MHEDLAWRTAEDGDVPALLALIAAAYRSGEGWTSEAHLIAGARITAPQLRAMIAAPDTVVMVIPASEGLLACCEVRDEGHGSAHFGLFAVDPARQAGGIGRRLLAAAQAVARERFDADTLEIQVVSAQTALIDWYVRLGFAATGQSTPFAPDAGDQALVEGLSFVAMRAPTRRPAYALSWSGGKDSALTLRALTAGGGPPPVALVTTIGQDSGRVTSHGVRVELIAAQAAALGLELVPVALPARAGNEAYRRGLADAFGDPPLTRAREIASGDLCLRDVRAFREQLTQGLGRSARFPLWGLDRHALARRFVRDGFRARIVCVDCSRLDPALAGREYDAKLLAELPADVDPCGENGELHTFVYDGPGFAAPVPCRPGEVTVREGLAYADLLPG